MNKIQKLISILAVLAFFERVFLDLGPNVELITVLMVISAFYLSTHQSLILVSATLILSDLIIGNTNILFFTWSGFLLPVLFFAKLNIKQKGLSKVALGTLSGISANIFFYFWTNFGVWYLDSWGMYPDTASGLMQSFIAGLPFLKYQLSSTLYFVPITILFFEFIDNSLKTRNLSVLFSKIKQLYQKSQYTSTDY